MNTTDAHSERITNHLNDLQMTTFNKFKSRLAEEMPKTRIDWVRAYSDDIIEVHIQLDKDTYKTGLQASTIATEVEAETDITIILM